MNDIIITNTNGQLAVSSLQVARDFEKRHDHIIRDIEELLPKIGEMSAKETSTQNCVNLFIESNYADSYGRCQKCYDITRDGFSLLVMGFTGKKALEWKLKYIEAFNLMEEKLKEIQKQTAIPDGFNAETLEIEEMNARTRMSSQLLKLAKTKAIPKPYRDRLLEKSVEVLTGEKPAISDSDSIQESEVEENAKYILSRLKLKKVDEVSFREIQRLCQKLKKSEDFREPIELLIQNNYIIEIPTDYCGKGQRPSQKYKITKA